VPERHPSPPWQAATEITKGPARRAARWVGDVVRGFTRAADGRDRAVELLASGDQERVGAAKYFLEQLAIAREEAGPLGLGARLAVTAGELAVMRLRAEDAVAPVLVKTKAIGEA